MMFHARLPWLALSGLFLLSSHPAPAQISISGVTDKAVYANSASFLVATQAGYSYGVFLNGVPALAGVTVTVSRPDYYELFAWRTNLAAPFDVVSARVRFIVYDSARGNTEWGLPTHTPRPVIQSSSNEFVGARLRLLVPARFPTGYEIPVVAWVLNEAGQAVRANGLLAAEAHPAIQIKRGVGSGFLAGTHPSGALSYAPRLHGLTTNKVIHLEADTVWTPVSGVLDGAVVWPENSRIRVTTNLTVNAGATLTIGAGTIVLLNPRVNITNDGTMLINGTVEQPVVFMPIARQQPWGGFFMRASAASVQGTGVIFTGSGADPTGGAGHRTEQCLFLVDNAPLISLTDAAAIHLAGQFGHAYNGGTFILTRFLLQRCTTGGEYTGAIFTVNDSAFLDFPDDSADFVDGDNDALYFVSVPTGAVSGFTNTLFGWTKDDGVDSGGSGYGALRYQSCWFEATFHEGNSLSGYKDVRVWDTVYFDCGQGIENGYNGPTNWNGRCLFAGCQVGARHGDNYTSNGDYTGRMTVTNSIFLDNHHDVFGYNWRSGAGNGWTQAVGQMIIRDNLFTVPDTNFPNNTLWNPATDAWRLGAFGAGGHVGLALAVRPGQTSLTNFPDGLPVALSSFCTNEVTVGYRLQTTQGTDLTGTLWFAPGQTRQFIPLPPGLVGVLRVTLQDPHNADLTGLSEVVLQHLPVVPPLVPRGAAWRYLDDGSNQGTAWVARGFDDRGWSNGLAELGFGDGDERTVIRRVGTNGQNSITFYFRHYFGVEDPAAFAQLTLSLLRDDGGVVYLNGTEVYRSPTMPQPPTPITYLTLATNLSVANAPPDNTVDTATISATVLVPGTNVVAVEIHQHRADSSDVSFDFSLVGVPASRAVLRWGRLGHDLALYWSQTGFVLEEAPSVTGDWTPVAQASPWVVRTNGTRFYRLRQSAP